MKTAQIFGCLILVVSSLTIARSENSLPALRVESSHTMKVAIVNADQRNPASERMYQALATSLGFEISQYYKTPIPVKAVLLDARDAAHALSNGSYDLVAVMGANVPSVLLSGDFKRLKAEPTTGNPNQSISLLMLKADRTLSTLMDHSFEVALNETFFQLAFASYRKLSVEREKTGWNVAIASLQ